MKTENLSQRSNHPAVIEFLESIFLLDSSLHSICFDIFEVTIKIFAPQRFSGLKFSEEANCTNVCLRFSGMANLKCEMEAQYPPPFLHDGSLAAADFISFDSERIVIGKQMAGASLNEIGEYDANTPVHTASIPLSGGCIYFDFKDVEVSDFEFDFDRRSTLKP